MAEIKKIKMTEARMGFCISCGTVVVDIDTRENCPACGVGFIDMSPEAMVQDGDVREGYILFEPPFKPSQLILERPQPDMNKMIGPGAQIEERINKYKPLKLPTKVKKCHNKK